MGLRKALAHLVMRVSRWTFTPGHPLPERCVVLGAPHTSNWDGFYMVVAMWALQRPFYFLVKKNLTDVPVIGRFVQAIGGIPVDRENPGHLVERVIALAQSSETFVLVIAPKGTRSIRPYWKSGFYRIAQGANLPVVPRIHRWRATPLWLGSPYRAQWESEQGYGCYPRVLCGNYWDSSREDLRSSSAQ